MDSDGATINASPAFDRWGSDDRRIDVRHGASVAMGRVRGALVLGLVLLCAPSSAITTMQEEAWREEGVDPTTWTDGPTLEGSPMDIPRDGNPVVAIDVRYQAELTGDREEGTIVLELFEEEVPNTVGNFIGLVDGVFYDGIFFHRVIDDFVIQSGDPTCRSFVAYPATNPTCGGGGSGESIEMEQHPNLTHVDGAIGMARGVDPDSAESQWYLCDGPQHDLDAENRDDEGYAVFGVIRDGMTHVRRIAASPTTNSLADDQILTVPGGPDRPVNEVELVRIRMIGVVEVPVEVVTTMESTDYLTVRVLIILAGLGAVGLAVVMSLESVRASKDHQESMEADLLDDT